MSKKVLVTGEGAICASGKEPGEIWDAARAGRSAIAPIQQWDSASWPSKLAGEIANFNPRALVEDRKLHKLVRRTDLLGLYAAAKAIEGAGLVAYRDALDPTGTDLFNDRTAVYVGSGGSTYQDQYDFFPLLTDAAGDLEAFGRELTGTVNPMWLLRVLPRDARDRRDGGGPSCGRGRPGGRGRTRFAGRAGDYPPLPCARPPRRGHGSAL
jgi:3-oxoacyl-(acyl-carrier-protein) synthase